MRIRSWMMLGIGYLAGSAAGRQKFEEIRSTVKEMTSSGPAAEMMDKVRTTLGMPESASSSDDDQSQSQHGGGAEGWQHQEGAWVPDAGQAASEAGSEHHQHAESTTGS